MTPKVSSMISVSTFNSLKNNVNIGTLKLLACLIEHNLPFRLLEHLPGLIKSICSDSTIAKHIKCSRTKGTNIILNILGPKSFKDTISLMKNNPFSVIVDETTDTSTKKCLAVIVRVLVKNKAKDRFLNLIEVEKSDAEHLYVAIKELFLSNNVPLKNFVGFAADNATVMMGTISGLATRFKSDIPQLFTLGCTCHSFNLCTSHACNKLPSSIEDLARDIYSYFSHSSKRINELNEFQSFYNIEPHKILKLSQTRWLSLQMVVNRILEQWQPLELFFTRAALEDNLQSAKTILHALKNPIYKIYFSFLSYILELINKLNVLFQSEKVLIHRLLPEVKKIYKIILNNYLLRDYIESTPVHLINPKMVSRYKDIENIYYGAKCELLVKNIQEKEDFSSDLKSFRLRALDFYIELCLQIRQRFQFDNILLNSLSNLEPIKALSGEVTSIVTLIEQIPSISESEYENINIEWIQLADIENKDYLKDLDFEEFWEKIMYLKDSCNQPMFPLLTKLLRHILCLPHSSAAAERIFSQLNLIKTKLRNRLSIKTCNALLLSRELIACSGNTCQEWQPGIELLNLKSNISANELNDALADADIDDLLI